MADCMLVCWLGRPETIDVPSISHCTSPHATDGKAVPARAALATVTSDAHSWLHEPVVEQCPQVSACYKHRRTIHGCHG